MMSHSFRSKSSGLIAIFSLLAVSEILLLNQNFSLKKRIREYQELQTLVSDLQKQNEKMQKQFEIEGKSLPAFLEQALLKMDNSDSARYYEFVLFFIFTPNSCDPCVEEEINTWNEFSKIYSSAQFQVVAVTEAKQALSAAILKKKLSIHFPLLGIEELDTELSQIGIYHTPAVLLFDLNRRKCIYAFLPNVTDGSKRKFTQKVKNFLWTAEAKFLK